MTAASQTLPRAVSVYVAKIPTAMLRTPTLSTLLLAAAVALLGACAKTEDGLVIRGTIEEASNLKVQFDQLNGPTEAFEQLETVEVDGGGSFELVLPDKPAAGVYRLRIGARKMPLVLDGTEEVVTVSGTLGDLERYAYDVEGSGSARSFQRILGGIAARDYDADDATRYVDTVANPWAGVYLGELVLGNGVYLDALKRGRQRLEADYAGTPYGTNYSMWVNQIEADNERQLAQERIQVGQPAPDITLPNPEGEDMSLSELEGNVVLLDFWASWCGPCRRANPTVVDVYNRYKDRGFTVYSVSLDGFDDNMRQRIEQSGDGLETRLAAQREKWERAIEKDRLDWPYHVSDLRKWSALPAQTYGVSAIPKTFLIDREGKIAAVNVHAGRLEQELTKLL